MNRINKTLDDLKKVAGDSADFSEGIERFRERMLRAVKVAGLKEASDGTDVKVMASGMIYFSVSSLKASIKSFIMTQNSRSDLVLKIVRELGHEVQKIFDESEELAKMVAGERGEQNETD